jgi:PadR family transcriptional regulator PadR
MYDMEPVDAMNPADPAVADALDRLRRGALESCVLTILSAGPAYSHDIVRTLGDIPGLVTSEGTVYPMLSRMRRAGLVQTHWQESPSGPPRRYYLLTEEGARAVGAFGLAWQTFRHAVDTILSGPGTAGGHPTAPSTTRHPLTTPLETR